VAAPVYIFLVWTNVDRGTCVEASRRRIAEPDVVKIEEEAWVGGVTSTVCLLVPDWTPLSWL
jgi:hypothetical protein